MKFYLVLNSISDLEKLKKSKKTKNTSAKIEEEELFEKYV